jgi:hypothetical protein
VYDGSGAGGVVTDGVVCVTVVVTVGVVCPPTGAVRDECGVVVTAGVAAVEVAAGAEVTAGDEVAADVELPTGVVTATLGDVVVGTADVVDAAAGVVTGGLCFAVTGWCATDDPKGLRAASTRGGAVCLARRWVPALAGGAACGAAGTEGSADAFA